LDELLTEGEFFWQMMPEGTNPKGMANEKPMIAFYRQADIDWEQPTFADDAVLSEEERKVTRALGMRGASFAQALSGVLAEKPVLPVLQSLAEKGLARSDSFYPVRQWLGGHKAQPDSPKARARLRAIAATGTAGATGGRWDLTRRLIPESLEAAILRGFEQSAILCRETAQDLTWPEALMILRIWEYTGRVRRGYFIKGLSGAQFIRDDAYRGTLLSLKSPREDVIWLSAADPLQSWGRVLAHMAGRSFTCIPSTAVALFKGVPVMVLEKNGQVLRAFDLSAAKDALFAFVAAFRQGRVFHGRTRVTVKQYPKEAEQALIATGFQRQMLDYELFK
jgi:ATP-dependent Lhr-like helicase